MATSIGINRADFHPAYNRLNIWYIGDAEEYFNKWKNENPTNLQEFIRHHVIDFSEGIFTRKGLGRVLRDLIINEEMIAVYGAKKALYEQQKEDV